ncbi:hypothetical protein NUW58_g8086 [Xylaria curta]|uniref:Uncharacterized protein n=1 Tax=Xylaria curta TaxID=42375 RepID=A0ACC1NBS5_9PEZI|nr:hypothetical protein NUW58_g8086 [Xylaria curta]
MFRIATPIVTEGHAKGEDLWDLLPRLQTQLDWAQNLPQSIFFEFFVCLIEARHGWERTPTYPYYDYEKYDPAVRELVSFRESIGDYGANNVSWVLNDGVFFNELAGGFTVDEDEGEDVIMGDPNLDTEDCHDHSEDPTIADVVLPLAQMNIEQK